MFVHSVYFWLKDTASATNLASFRAGVETLRNIETVKAMYVGVPAPTDRPVIDRSYTVALTVGFDDLAGHDAYQEHAIHLDFVKAYGDRWERVQIYDAV
jgi:hypothetical protein